MLQGCLLCWVNLVCVHNTNNNNKNNNNNNNNNNNLSPLLKMLEANYRLTPGCHDGRLSPFDSYDTYLRIVCHSKPRYPILSLLLHRAFWKFTEYYTSTNALIIYYILVYFFTDWASLHTPLHWKQRIHKHTICCNITDIYNDIFPILTCNFSKEQYVLPENDLRIETRRSILSVLM